MYNRNAKSHKSYSTLVAEIHNQLNAGFILADMKLAPFRYEIR